MTTEIPKTYAPDAIENKITQTWLDAGVFHCDPDTYPQNSDPFTVLMPPPNVTAALHLGHALNGTLQDIVSRYARMCGNPTLFLPGTDHAGISTQTVVEKRLIATGVSRLDLGREAFIEKTKQWKDEYEEIITDQIRSIGAGCDWDRLRFTMDDMCSTAVNYGFWALFRDGLIYRGKRLVNWDPVTKTALADDEVESIEVSGHMWYLRYPLADDTSKPTEEYITVATTRPETMFGDTAVAMSPADQRSEELVGRNVVLPIVGRIIPIIADEHVVMADRNADDQKARLATGFLKVTPAHDPTDAEIGRSHGLPAINVMADDASIIALDDAGSEMDQFVGLSREHARDAVIEWFDNSGLLERVENLTHSVGHSYRSHAPIEPWLSDQWYVRVTDDRLKGSALRALNPAQSEGLAPNELAGDANGDGQLTFTPPRYSKMYQSWHENIRDWCISRQLWWGHQIPVWSKTSPSPETTPGGLSEQFSNVDDSDYVAAGACHKQRITDSGEVEQSVCVPPKATMARTNPKTNYEELIAKLEANGFVRDPDVLDTWFSSGLWPLSTLGWPYPEDYPETVGLFEHNNPTNVLMTAREIITLWVSRMTMFNRYFKNGDVPFTNVYIHAIIQDGQGQKMSKSLGNGVDPRDIINSHGADALRYTLASLETGTQDARMPVEAVCPHHPGETFKPKQITTSAGSVVAAPTQVCPTDPSLKMATPYGVAVGAVEVNDHHPLSRNTSSKFDPGRNFCNKLWNATRFGLSKLNNAPCDPVDPADQTFIDRWVLARLEETTKQVSTAIESYQFSKLTDVLYDFIWRDLCDVYLEAIKPTISSNRPQQVILGNVLDVSLRLLHPVCPFITEQLWGHLGEFDLGEVKGIELGEERSLLAVAQWPTVQPNITGDEIEIFEEIQRLIAEVRNIRAQQNLKPSAKVSLIAADPIIDLIGRTDNVALTLAGVASADPIDKHELRSHPGFTFDGESVFVVTAEGLNGAAEAARLSKKIDQLQAQITNLEKRLANPNYVEKAKAELVQQSREQLRISKAELTATRLAMDGLHR